MDHQMEVEEDIFNSYIKCKICNKILEEPVTLPCSKTVCASHLKNINILHLSFCCCFCDEIHNINFEKLPLNKEMEELIEKRNKYINIDSIDFGENNKIAKYSCKILKSLLDDAKLMTNEPANCIHEYFSELKNKIDQTREEYVQMIENKYESIINEVLKIEKECKTKAEKRDNDLVRLIDEIEMKLNYRNESLKVPNFSKDEEWKSFRFEVAKEIVKIEHEIEKYKNELFFNQDFEFTPIPIMNENNFGNFKSKNIDCGKINMVLDNFSKLKSTHRIFNESNITFINDIPWIIETRLEKENQANDYLVCYVTPLCNNERLNNDPINTKVKLRILQNETRELDAFKEFIFFNKFTEAEGYGFGYGDFISKEDLLNPSNGFYDKENDSITLEATIMYLN